MAPRLWLPALILCAAVAATSQGFGQPQGETADAADQAATIDWNECLACHEIAGMELPPLNDLRLSGLGARLKQDCLDCHNRAELTDISGVWLHPTRPLAGHVACAVCHTAGPHDADAPPPPARWDKRTEEQCLACHRTIELALAQQYSHGFAPGVRCRDCHPAHAPLAAALPQSILPRDVAELRSGYNWQDSNRQCLTCHSEAQLTLSLDRGFVTLNTVNYHDLHLLRGDVMCIECHDPHGSMRPGMLRPLLLSGEVFHYTPNLGGGTCAVTCHGISHDSWSYRNKVY